VADSDHKQRPQAKLAALDHPLRLEILTALALRPASAKELAAELGAPVGKIRYQLGRLRKAGLVEQRESRQRRGVLEQVYVAPPEPVWDEEFDEVSPPQREKAVAAILKTILSDVTKAMRAGSFARRDDVVVVRTPLRVDQQGWAEATKVHRDALADLLKVRERSMDRIEAGAAPAADAYSFLLLFDMVPPSENAR
jgi:DNA-binding transcriptional ArsR family regulator